MGFDLHNDVLKVVIPSEIPDGHPLSFSATSMQELGTSAALRLTKEGFMNVVLVEKPFAFFVHSQSSADERKKQFAGYILTLKAICADNVTLGEQQKHAQIVRVYHDMFTHQIPTDTCVDFSPTLAMATVSIG